MPSSRSRTASALSCLWWCNNSSSRDSSLLDRLMFASNCTSNNMAVNSSGDSPHVRAHAPCQFSTRSALWDQSPRHTGGSTSQYPTVASARRRSAPTSPEAVVRLAGALSLAQGRQPSLLATPPPRWVEWRSCQGACFPCTARTRCAIATKTTPPWVGDPAPHPAQTWAAVRRAHRPGVSENSCAVCRHERRAVPARCSNRCRQGGRVTPAALAWGWTSAESSSLTTKLRASLKGWTM